MAHHGRVRRGTGGAAAVVAVVLLGGCSPSTSAPVPAVTSAQPGGTATIGQPAPRPPAAAFEAVVTAVVDGDTLRATVAGRRGEVKVRLIGVDTPETRRPGVGVQCWGPQASAAMSALAPPGTRLRAAFQPEQRTDRYGRDLWDLWLPDGRFLQGELVARGDAVARSYPPTTAHASYLEGLQDAARAAMLGLWRACPAAEVPRHD